MAQPNTRCCIQHMATVEAQLEAEEAACIPLGKALVSPSSGTDIYPPHRRYACVCVSCHHYLRASYLAQASGCDATTVVR